MRGNSRVTAALLGTDCTDSTDAVTVVDPPAEGEETGAVGVVAAARGRGKRARKAAQRFRPEEQLGDAEIYRKRRREQGGK
jgi:hypothetical protein